MRTLGSFFHIAMNGMAASEKIFKCLDLAEPADCHLNIDPLHCDIEMENVDFSYDGQTSDFKKCIDEIFTGEIHSYRWRKRLWKK